MNLPSLQLHEQRASVTLYKFSEISRTAASQKNSASGRISNNAWKVSVFGVFLVCIFPHSDWIRTRKTLNTDTFHAVAMITLLEKKTSFFIFQHLFPSSNRIFLFHKSKETYPNLHKNKGITSPPMFVNERLQLSNAKIWLT